MSRPVDESDARRWLARRRPPSQGRPPEQDRTHGPDGWLVSWCIADLSTDEALGNIDVFDIGRPVLPGGCELGYWTHPDSRGQGLMTDALRRLLPHLLGSTESGGLGLRRVTARTSELNAASKSVMSAVGMRQWGAAPGGSIAPDGAAVSQLHFAVLADELDPATGRVQGNASAVEPVTLEGNGIRLREWRHTDAERVMEACSDEQTRHWLAGSLPSPYTLDHAHSYIRGCIDEARDGKAVYWCVADLESDLCLGSVSVMDLRNAFGTAGEIGYWLHPDARRRGVMSRAVGLVVRHAFIAREDGGLGRIRLRLNAADGNLASQQIARTNGFVEVGRDRLAEPLGDGTFADLVRFDLLVDEWNAAD
jgi:RimJ/RimL family protein N-acetyltransferase